MGSDQKHTTHPRLFMLSLNASKFRRGSIHASDQSYPSLMSWHCLEPLKNDCRTAMGPCASSAAVAVFYFAVAVFYFVGLSEWRRFTGMIPAASADLNTKVGVVVGTAVFFLSFSGSARWSLDLRRHPGRTNEPSYHPGQSHGGSDTPRGQRHDSG